MHEISSHRQVAPFPDQPIDRGQILFTRAHCIVPHVRTTIMPASPCPHPTRAQFFDLFERHHLHVPSFRPHTRFRSCSCGSFPPFFFTRAPAKPGRRPLRSRLCELMWWGSRTTPPSFEKCFLAQQQPLPPSPSISCITPLLHFELPHSNKLSTVHSTPALPTWSSRRTSTSPGRARRPPAMRAAR